MHKRFSALWILVLAVHVEYNAGEAENVALTTAALPSLDSANFQRLFLAEVTKQINVGLSNCMDNYLRVLQKEPTYAQYAQQLNEILLNKAAGEDYLADGYKIMEEKIVFVKQLLDSKAAEGAPKLYTLRNMKFFKRLQQQLAELAAEGEREWREMKMYQLCQQFQGGDKRAGKNRADTRPASLWAHIELAPMALERLQEGNGNASRPRPLSLQDFGATVYERVKVIGAQIIDDCLRTLRKLLIEVSEEERPDNNTHSEGLAKLLQHIEDIMQTADFAAKRERLYNYMQTSLAQDYEQFKSSQSSPKDVAELLLKMQLRGLDLFFNFLFSNFEFLEHLHAQWSQLTATLESGDSGSSDNSETDDANLRELLKISALYDDFKENSDDTEKYEAYLQATKQLHERTRTLPADGAQIYEILYSAAQNVGTVTLNMIKTKCSQL